MPVKGSLVRPVMIFFGCAKKAIEEVGNNNDYSEIITGVKPVVVNLTLDEIGWQARNALGDERYAEFLRMIVDGVVAKQGVDIATDPGWNKSVRLLMLGGQFDTDDRVAKDMLKKMFPKARYFKANQYGQVEKLWARPGRKAKVNGEMQRDNPLLNFRIEELEFGVRTHNCLKRVGIETIGDLVTKSEEELKEIPNFGKKCVEEVLETLDNHHLSLRKEGDEQDAFKN
jgi:hypothetical protein